MAFYMTIGLPGCGKSTWAEKTGFEIISSDAMREQLGLADNDNSVFPLMESRVLSLVASGTDVIYDATNLEHVKRINLLSKLYSTEKVAVVFPTPLEVCKERNHGRERVVPDFVYDRMLKNFDVPYVTESFDRVTSFVDDSLLNYDFGEITGVNAEKFYQTFCKNVLNSVSNSSVDELGLTNIETEKLGQRIELRKLLPVSSDKTILNNAYDSGYLANGNSPVHHVLRERFSAKSFFDQLDAPDELTNFIYGSSNDSVKLPSKKEIPEEDCFRVLGEQTSKYHKETLKEHVLLVLGGMWEDGVRDEKALLLGLLHDASKKYDAIINKRGEIGFYNHEQNSAFFAANVFYQLGYSRQEIAPYVGAIYGHLMPFTWNQDVVHMKKGDVPGNFVRDLYIKSHGSDAANLCDFLNHYDKGVPDRSLLTTKEYQDRLLAGRVAIRYLDDNGIWKESELGPSKISDREFTVRDSFLDKLAENIEEYSDAVKKSRSLYETQRKYEEVSEIESDKKPDDDFDLMY